MTARIVFSTQGLLDLKAITTFGMNSKPNTTSPIGYFGTGLKYAIAVLVREGIEVSIFIGPREYVFYAKEIDFRGKEHNQVMMKQRNGLFSKWTWRTLPFTTELGKNWELWQAFRELESNTRDENGSTYSVVNDHEVISPTSGTLIVVTGDRFAEEFDKMSDTFLEGGMTQREGNTNLQVFDRPSNFLYYRSMRIIELKKPSRLTYNILSQIDLTEDRTAKYQHQIDEAICSFVACDTSDEKLINTIVTADSTQFYEGNLSFDYFFRAPSKQFVELLEKKKRRAGATSVMPRISSYYERYVPPPPKDESAMLWYQLRDLYQDDVYDWSPDNKDLLKQCIEALRLARTARAITSPAAQLAEDDIPF